MLCHNLNGEKIIKVLVMRNNEPVLAIKKLIKLKTRKIYTKNISLRTFFLYLTLLMSAKLNNAFLGKGEEKK